MSIWGSLAGFGKELGEDILNDAKDQVERRIAAIEDDLGGTAIKIGGGLKADAAARQARINTPLIIAGAVGAVSLGILFFFLKG